MADLGHLEKMGRELKCPICLSLLESAVSLACNHVFCNSCILKSMKSVSDCPVCKAPFRRREVRAAPHMDNLVRLFKGMEVALGVNIFTTQVALSAKISEEGWNQVRGERNSPEPEAKMACSEGATRVDDDNSIAIEIAHKEKSKGKRLSLKSQKDLEKSDVRTLAKKRVHVMPYPVTETPLRPEKVSKYGPPNSEFEANRLLGRNERIGADEQGDPLFSPFFWLREKNDEDDDSEKLSSKHTENASPPKTFPCFSDIKDSDDDTMFVKVTPTSKLIVSDTSDAEMFEWTQRACSPELHSTPPKRKTAGRHRVERFQKKKVLPNSERSKTTQSNENARTVEARKGANKKKRPNCKAHRKNVNIPQCRNTTAVEVLPEVHLDSGEAPKSSNKGSECKEHKKPGGLKINGNKSTSHYLRKHVKNPPHQLNHTASAASREQFPATSSIVKKQNQEKDTTIVSPVLPCLMGANNKVLDLKSKSKKRGEKVMFQIPRKRIKTSNDGSVAKAPEEVCAKPAKKKISKEQGCLKVCMNIQSSLEKESENEQCSLSGLSGPLKNKKIQKKMVKPLEPKKRRTNASTAGVVMCKNTDNTTLALMAGCEKNQTASNLQIHDGLATKSSTETKEFLALTGDVLKKCKTMHSQIKCAFCQSSDDTEISGEKLHYLNGKPVAPVCNEAANVIHSHKNCTEWAPNVYFDDELAVNLANELSRSKRINCSSCGIKGAALGCYEKSCRKSFHFPCAKLIPECRWDNENFVMLCPLHQSSKLPSETSEPLRQHKKRSPKLKMQTPSINNPCPAMNKNWTWPSESPCKWVLCCSGLTVAEKEIVSEFTRLTGIPISKTWIPSVTHVIASTDENRACRRTMKILRGILDGKWILSINWIKACMETMGPVDEDYYEITLDVHGISGGPQLGRLRISNKQPKLFGGFRFYFTGAFVPSYKGYLHDLVNAAGGTVLQRKPITRDQEKLLDDSPASATFIIYSLEPAEKKKCTLDAAVLNHRQEEAQALADACGAKVASTSWVLDSIAACKLQPLA